MVVSMELSVCRSFVSVASPATLWPRSSNFVFCSCFFRRRRFCESFNWKSKTLSQITTCVERDSSINGEDEANCAGFWGDSEFVEVMGIGSRKDAILDFCLDSPFQFSSLRFWNVLMGDSLKVQLQQRVVGKDINPKIVEAPLSLQSSSKAIILVASAGYGLDHITTIDILRTIRSANGFAVAIILKPFSFEGQRRQDEVRDLVGKLHEHSNFYIDIDMDTLLKKDLVTLDEALKTANNAVLWAINAIYVLISETQKKFRVVQRNNANYLKEIEVSEVTKILDSYKEAKLGFGAGYNIETSIAQAINDCPFLGVGLKDLNGIIICVLASSVDIGLYDPLRTFRQTTNYTREIIISTIHDPNLEPNLVVTTVVVLGCIEQDISQKSSILSRLAQSFPLVLNFLRKHHPEPYTTQGNDAIKTSHVNKEINSPEYGEWENRDSVNEISKGFDKHPEELHTVLCGNNDNYVTSEFEQNEFGLLEAKSESSNFYDQLTKGPFQREQLNSWNLGPGYQIAQEWAKERAIDFGTTTTLADNLSIFHLPVGVRPSEDLNDGSNISSATQNQDPNSRDDLKKQPIVNSSMSSWGALTDVGFEAARDLYNTTSTILKTKYADAPKKQGVLSIRAASMLEAERDSPKKWSPTLEMQYRGGVYRGRCQGGLPEGKGQLVLGDGNIYDGMWRYGKRSGLGTFYFNNGDVFQGSWKDDIMHGKGWFYFHTGDRWFANFWKGKANGEGRFYSKSGDIFFGHFQDGWRHGHFLCIKVDGARYVEIWDEGVLVDCKDVSDTDDGCMQTLQKRR